MSSSDDQIIQSVDGIISAVEKLVGDIRVAPDIETEAKNFALNKVGGVVKDLDLINRALFLNDYPAASVTPDTPVTSVALNENSETARTTVIAETDDTINDMLSSWSQPVSGPVSQSVVSEAGDGAKTADAGVSSHEQQPAKKPRIIVSPVTRTVPETTPETDAAEHVGAGESQEEQDFTVASSFEESLISSLSHSETSLVGERDAVGAHSTEADDKAKDKLEEQLSDEELTLKADPHDTEILETDETDQADTSVEAGSVKKEKVAADDLTLIQGIDEDVSELLSQHGIYSFLDIVEFKEADMLRLSEELSDPCRVSRENWIEQATLLAKNVSTYYAQKNNDEISFDRLSLNKFYSIHPEVIAEQNGTPDLEPSAFNTDEQQEIVGRVEEDMLSGEFYEDANLYEDTEEGKADLVEASVELVENFAEVQEFTDALLAKKLALEAELASLTAQMVQKSEANESLKANVPFLEHDEDKVGVETLTSPVVDVLTHEEGQNELVDAFNIHDGEEASNFASDNDLGDGPIWHEEVSTGKDYVPPVVEDDFETQTDAQDYDASGAHFAQSQQDINQPQFSEQQESLRQNTEDHFSQSEPLSNLPPLDNFVEESVPFLNSQEGKNYIEPQGFPLETTLFAPGDEYEEQSPPHEKTYTYSVDQLSDHVPMSNLDEMSDFHPGDKMEEGSVPLNQAEYMDDISVPRDTMVSGGPSIRADQGLGDPGFMERSLSPSDMPPTDMRPAGFEKNEINENGHLLQVGQAVQEGQDAFAPNLQAGETVSDKIPEIKEKIGNDRTLGQYLASKSQGELTGASDREREDQALNEVPIQNIEQTYGVEHSNFSPPLPPQNEGYNELSRQDMSISLPPSPLVAPQINMSDMRRPVMPPSNIPHPPAPPIANGVRVPPVVSREMQGIAPPEIRPSETLAEPQQGRSLVPPFVDGPETRSMPPLPPQGMPPQSPPSQVEGPTPPPFTDMPSPVSEGQAYADTQRIIAAKRQADVEKAKNRSDIQNGQAYMDTQQLMDNGVPFEPQQNAGRLSGPNDIPPLPPEAVKAASAYPKGAHNPELHYRGHKPQQFSEEGLPPLDTNAGHFANGNGGRNGNQKNVAPTGFKAKAKQLAESLQRSFVDKE